MGRPRGTVHAYSTGAQALQHHCRRGGIRSVKGTPPCLKGHGHHHRKTADLLCGNQSRPGFSQTHHGLHNQQIHPCLTESRNLFLIDINQLLRIQLSHRPQGFPRHGQITGHIHLPVRRLIRRFPGNAHQVPDQRMQFTFQSVFRQLDPVGGKGRSIENVAPCRHIFFLQIQHNIPVLQNPLLRAHAGGHACPHQI